MPWFVFCDMSCVEKKWDWHLYDLFHSSVLFRKFGRQETKGIVLSDSEPEKYHNVFQVSLVLFWKRIQAFFAFRPPVLSTFDSYNQNPRIRPHSLLFQTISSTFLVVLLWPIKRFVSNWNRRHDFVFIGYSERVSCVCVYNILHFMLITLLYFCL